MPCLRQLGLQGTRRVSQDLGYYCQGWGSFIFAGGAAFCAHSSALSLSPSWVWIRPLVGMNRGTWRCCSGAVPAAGGESSSGAVQPAPIATAASVPKPTIGNKSLSLLSAAGSGTSARNLAGGFEPVVPRPPPLALPSLPRKMETGDEGTFLYCIQLCPLPDYHHDIILTCKS